MIMAAYHIKNQIEGIVAFENEKRVKTASHPRRPGIGGKRGRR